MKDVKNELEDTKESFNSLDMEGYVANSEDNETMRDFANYDERD